MAFSVSGVPMITVRTKMTPKKIIAMKIDDNTSNSSNNANLW